MLLEENQFAEAVWICVFFFCWMNEFGDSDSIYILLLYEPPLDHSKLTVITSQWRCLLNLDHKHTISVTTRMCTDKQVSRQIQHDSRITNKDPGNGEIRGPIEPAGIGGTLLCWRRIRWRRSVPAAAGKWLSLHLKRVNKRPQEEDSGEFVFVWIP